MQNLWGEETQPRQNKRQPATRSTVQRISLTAQDCLMFGHSFTPAGMSNEKICSVCGIHAYCPTCTPIAPRSAIPFFCTRHTPEMRVQA
jgi:hypothetical protein